MSMKRTNLLLIGVLAMGTAFTSCKKKGCTDPTATNYSSEAEKDDESCQYAPAATTKDLTLNISGLEDLGASYKYETWIIVNGSPVSIGTFDVNAAGTMSTTTFTGSISDVDAAAMFVLSIEPFPDTDPTPSDVKILGGAFSGNSATLAVSHPAALGDDLSAAAGDYIIATPTTNATADDLSGVWFFNPGATTPQLTLPTLPAGWEYEGWAVIGGTPVSTGKFSDAAMADGDASFSGSDNTGPAYPGEDFIVNAPTGLTFPTDLSGQTMVISIEPVPDNSAAPFLLKPLVGMAPAAATPMTPYTLNNNASATNPTGTATR